nr:DUF3365 domain-containing protein [uncultured Brumimicrobium sp.]
MKKLILTLISPLFFMACSSPEDGQNLSNDDQKTDSTMINQELSKEELERYREIGIQYASTTQKALGQKLTQALSKGGAEHALQFCNIQAMPITDSMANLHNAELSRVSDRPRNQSNTANANELEQIAHFKQLLADGKVGTELQPNIKIDGDQVHFYSPIVTNAMCLQCHGSKEEMIQPETLALISDLYPEDKATGYQANEVRGIWSIIFEKQ